MLQLLLHLCHLHHAEEAQANGLEPLPREAFVSRPEAEEVCKLVGGIGAGREEKAGMLRGKVLSFPSFPTRRVCQHLITRAANTQVYEAREEHFLRKFLRQALKEGLFRTSTRTHAAEGSEEKGGSGAVVTVDWANVRRSFAKPVPLPTALAITS